MSTEHSYAGEPANIPGANVFNFMFSNPFQQESEFTPPKQRVPKIHDDQPIFIDHASGKFEVAYEDTMRLKLHRVPQPCFLFHVLICKSRSASYLFAVET